MLKKFLFLFELTFITLACANANVIQNIPKENVIKTTSPEDGDKFEGDIVGVVSIAFFIDRDHYCVVVLLVPCKIKIIWFGSTIIHNLKS